MVARKETYADLAGKGTMLLSDHWSICAHRKGFWFGAASRVSDESGKYLKLTGDCKTCKKAVVAYQRLEA